MDNFSDSPVSSGNLTQNSANNAEREANVDVAKATSVYLALGTNLGDRNVNLSEALRLIQHRCGKLLKISSIYETHPLPVPNVTQGTYYNMAVQLETELDPRALLDQLLDIEQVVGRNRKEEVMWGPRVIDLDIISYGELTSLEENPQIPHPRYRSRDFVLLPIKELNPDFLDPKSGESVDSLLARIPAEARTAFRKLPFSLSCPTN
ncbi:MAG: 2-amino-4-hydroxy-6-hydroxymethyldihydropteridine diphosphokinase [Bdellovibrionales bacterium]|nr:2-amino-4-hydroxy-6-hydroxymethyldihydropteridine diphosphokinase [Bdellovibrionales bacterium]